MASRNVVVLISGRGSNLDALARAARDEAWSHAIDARVAAVISNRADAQGLSVAHAHGIATHVVDHRAHADREGFDAALMAAIDAYTPALVVLAGFMRILTQGLVEHYAGRLMNVHPSLLPAFAGLATHRRALEAGVRWHGATVHYVTPTLDHGPIVMQGAVGVDASDTETSLAARVLAIEHVILPRAVRWHLEGHLAIDGMRVVHRHGAPQWVVA